MNPDRQPLALDVQQVVWLPSSPTAIEVRVFGAWSGSTVPPAVELVVGSSRVAAQRDAPAAGAPPAWSAAFLAPVEWRAALEAGEGRLEAGDVAVALPPAVPGTMGEVIDDEPGGTVVDPAVLAERRARRAELAEQSAFERAATAEQTVETLRTQLGHLEERLAGAATERDRLAARVADAERRLRLAEQREEAERRRRTELEEETLATRRDVEAELVELRDRLAGAEEVTAAIEQELHHARRRQAAAERAAQSDRAARRDLEAELATANARLAALEAVGATDPAELERLRASAAAADPAELDQLRARAAAAEAAAAEIGELHARAAAAEAAAAEIDDLRGRLAAATTSRGEVEDLRRRLAEEETRGHEVDARVAAEGAGDRAREQALAGQVAALEAELARRTVAQERVHGSIAGVREELARVRALVDAGHVAEPAVRAQLTALDDRRRVLEGSLRRRDAEVTGLRDAVDTARATAAAARTEADEHRAALVAARRDAADLQARLDDERRHRAAAERDVADAPADGLGGRRADLEARVHELAAEIAAIRARMRDATADLEARVADERARRETAEALLAQHRAERPEHPIHAPEVAPDVDPRTRPDLPPDVGPDVTPDVDEDDPDAPPVDPDAPRVDPTGTVTRTEPQSADPADPFPSTGDHALDELIAGLRAQVASAREQLDAWDAERPEAASPPTSSAPPSPATASPATAPLAAAPSSADAAPSSAAAVPSPARPPSSAAALPSAPPPSAARAAAADEVTRQRLAAIERELRAAVPEGSVATPARDVIASLQRAADRLRTAAEEELAALEDDPPIGREDQVDPVAGLASPPAPLGERATTSAREGAWLRTGLERLAATDAALAVDLLVALLPAQALVADRLTYELGVPGQAPVRVSLHEGLARVERPPASPALPDAAVTGSLAALAPLAAGGASWRLPDLDVSGARRKLRRLAWARRRPVTFGDLAKVTPPPDPRLLLAALAAAVEPAWTLGARFGVAYAFAGDGRWAILAHDGAPLRVVVDDAQDRDATVHAGPHALLALLAGAAQPAARPATVEGDRAAADQLHAWFDRARGVAPAAPAAAAR